MLGEVNRPALHHEVHRSIEETATVTAQQMMVRACELTYPPNCGLLPDEEAALASIPKSDAMERALRKLIADAAVYPLFNLFSILDNVVELPELGNVEPHECSPGLMLHDALYDSYWSWRQRRPNPGWKLDTYEGD